MSATSGCVGFIQGPGGGLSYRKDYRRQDSMSLVMYIVSSLFVNVCFVIASTRGVRIVVACVHIAHISERGKPGGDPTWPLRLVPISTGCNKWH